LFVIEFFVEALAAKTLLDPFAYRSNIIHDPDQLDALLGSTPWQIANVEIAKELGRLITSAGSLVHGLYNDVCTDYAWDAYGPYPLPNNQVLLIRHFTDLQPVTLWSDRDLIDAIPAQEIALYELYNPIECSIRAVGCHTVFEGSATQQLVSFALSVDGRWIHDMSAIKRLRTRLALEAQRQYQHIRNCSESELRKKVVEQECYQLKKLFDFVGMDWRPSTQMLERAQLPLLENRYPKGRFMTFEEYCQCMGINELKKLYRVEYQRHPGPATAGSPDFSGDLTRIRSDSGQARMTTTHYSLPTTHSYGWLDDYLNAFAKTVTNSDAAGWMPFDYHRFYAHVSDLMLDRWLTVVDRLRQSRRSAVEIGKTLGGPLTLRFQLIFTNLFHIQAADRRDDPDAWQALEFLNDVVRTGNSDDPYGHTSAHIHTPQEIEHLRQSILWQEATPASRQEITRLLSAATHLAWALYGDYCYMNWYEIFGPYPLPGNRQLLIRAFTNFTPSEVWSETADFPVHNLTLYQIFKDTDIQLDQWSHTTATTTIGQRLEQWSLIVDGKPLTDLQRIREIRRQMEQGASQQYQRFAGLSFEEQKQKILELEGYGLKNLFALAEVDWRPTPEMLDRIRGKPLLPDKYPKFETQEEARKWWKLFADPRTEENFPEEWMTKNIT